MKQNGAFNEKYKILKHIAEGGMADIFLATSSTDSENEFSIIKKVARSYEQKKEFQAYLKDESKILSVLNHKNIIGFRELIDDGQKVSLVMEFVHGKSLKEVIRDLNESGKCLSHDCIIYLISEIAKGLEQAHVAVDPFLKQPLNLVHRDINPQNIMISYDGKVKIIDFGVSKFALQNEETKTGFLKGKLSYMSPEQINGENIDARTDIFALGIIMWELLTGRRLFDGKDDFERYDKVLGQQIPEVTMIDPSIPKEIEFVVTKALARNVNERFQSANELVKALSKVMILKFPDFKPSFFENCISFHYKNEFNSSIESLKNLVNQKISSVSSDESEVQLLNINQVDERSASYSNAAFNQTAVKTRSIAISKSFDTKLTQLTATSQQTSSGQFFSKKKKIKKWRGPTNTYELYYGRHDFKSNENVSVVENLNQALYESASFVIGAAGLVYAIVLINKMNLLTSALSGIKALL